MVSEQEKNNKQKDTEAAGEMEIASRSCSKKTLANYTNTQDGKMWSRNE